MPRKVGIGPAILRIEGLSTGKDPLAVDDITGEPLAQPHAKPPKIDNVEQERERRRRLIREHKMDLLNRSLYAKPKLIEVVPKGFRKIGELGGKAVLYPLPPWRRI